MFINKIINGFMVQKINPKTGKCVSQEFVASDEAVYETMDGESFNDVEKDEEFPMLVIQPEGDQKSC